jgi:uncharacterized protein (UPF0147 family)
VQQAIKELDEVIADEHAPRNVRDAAANLRRAVLDGTRPAAELLLIVIKHRAKEQDRYGK